MSGTSVQGRLRSHSEFWISELDPSQFVKDVVQTGYRLPFVNLSEPCCTLNHCSAYEDPIFVSSAIEELVAASCIVETDICPLFSL